MHVDKMVLIQNSVLYIVSDLVAYFCNLRLFSLFGEKVEICRTGKRKDTLSLLLY